MPLLRATHRMPGDEGAEERPLICDADGHLLTATRIDGDAVSPAALNGSEVIETATLDLGQTGGYNLLLALVEGGTPSAGFQLEILGADDPAGPWYPTIGLDGLLASVAGVLGLRSYPMHRYAKAQLTNGALPAGGVVGLRLRALHT